jgi:hypothetical protein
MLRMAGVLLAALILQPIAAVVCQARCAEDLPAAASSPASHCHQATGSGEVLTGSRGDACAHPAPVDRTVRSTPLQVAAPPVTRFTLAHLVVPHPPAPTSSAPAASHRSPDDSSGTLRV